MLTDILKQANEFYFRRRKKGSPAWFRGHSSSTYKLKSTLHRHIEKTMTDVAAPLSDEVLGKYLRDEYQSIYRSFSNNAWPLLSEIERSEWGIIFTMQHYGLPTRLLDWTESFLCALYFAHLGRERNESATIWCIDPQALNLAAIGGHGMIALDDGRGESSFDTRSWHPRYIQKLKRGKKKPKKRMAKVVIPPLAVSSIFVNPRMTAQNAAFTMMGDSFETLDEQFPQLVADGLLMQIELNPHTYDDAEDFLRIMGCSAFTYFPDLDGLAKRHRMEVAQTAADMRRFYAEHLKPKSG